ncbi:MAG: hypothetical protein IKC59_08355 [Clostridia bacterium]|nr:hypothetical protein [Clostridia bacterium]
MRLFGKHLLRTVRRAPFQPFLIFLTVVCSVAIAIAAMRIPMIFDIRAEEEVRSASESGDLRITMRADSEARMLFCEDAEAVLGEDGTVLGEFRLTGFYETNGQRDVLSVSAVDLPTADAFYHFQYLSYGRFDAQNLKQSVILSASFAEEHSLQVGDALQIRVLDEMLDFTVQAVARDTGLLAETQMLIPMERFVSVLAERVPMIAGLGADLLPYNRLLIRLSDGVSESVILDRFSSSPTFSDKTVESADATAKSEMNLQIQKISLWIPACLLLVLSVLLVASSLRLLRLQRQTETALFCAAGAAPRQLWAMEVGESAFYAVLGSIGGVFLSRPVVAAASRLFWLQTLPLATAPWVEWLGFLWAVLLMVGTTLLQLRRQKERPLAVRLQGDETVDSRFTPNGRLILFFACVFAISMGVSLFLPIKHRVYSATVALLSILCVLFFFAPWALRHGMAGVSRLIQSCKHPAPAWMLSAKNIQNSPFLQHVGQLLTLLFAFLMTLGTVTQSFARQNTSFSAFVTADLACLHADSATEELLRAHPSSEGVCRVGYYRYVGLSNGVSVGGISVVGDASACLKGELLPTVLPTGDAVAISEGIARLTEASVGDVFSMTVNGISHDYLVTEVLPSHLPLVVFDSDSVGLERELLLVRTSNDQPQLLALIEERGAIAVSADLLFRKTTDLLDAYLSLISWAIPAAAAMAVAGSLNLWAEQFRARRREREILRENGYTSIGVLCQQLTENALLLLFAFLISLPFTWTMCYLIDFGVASFGVVLI